MDKLLETLKHLLPEEQVKEISEAVAQVFEEAKSELEAEAQQHLDEAYNQLNSQKAEIEKTAYEGYQEAWGMIAELRNRLERQREEHDEVMNAEFEEAYRLLQVEKSRNDNIAAELYEAYDNRLADMKEYIVDKVNDFLEYKGHEIYEQAKRDVLSDPRNVEHKIALEKIIDVTRNYMSEEEATFASSSKLEEARQQAKSLESQMKILESKNSRLVYENQKLNESVKAAEAKVITEAAKVEKVEKKERLELGKKASGRGEVVIEETLIAEYGVKENTPKKTTDVDTSKIDESSDYYDALRLAGVVVPE